MNLGIKKVVEAKTFSRVLFDCCRSNGKAPIRGCYIQIRRNGEVEGVWSCDAHYDEVRTHFQELLDRTNCPTCQQPRRWLLHC